MKNFQHKIVTFFFTDGVGFDKINVFFELVQKAKKIILQKIMTD